MAIKKQIELENGVNVEYIRIKGIIKRGGLDNDSELILEYYINQEARNNDKSFVVTKSETVPTVNSIEEAYVELKKIEQYADAEDILDEE
jgi:hypothetical protein